MTSPRRRTTARVKYVTPDDVLDKREDESEPIDASQAVARKPYPWWAAAEGFDVSIERPQSIISSDQNRLLPPPPRPSKPVQDVMRVKKIFYATSHYYGLRFFFGTGCMTILGLYCGDYWLHFLDGWYGFLAPVGVACIVMLAVFTALDVENPVQRVYEEEVQK